MAIDAIVAAVTDIVSTVAAGAEAVGGAIAGGVEAAGAALAPEAVAGEAAAAAIPTGAEAAATAGEIAAETGGLALPTLEVPGVLGGVVGGEAAAGLGGAALGGATEAALAGGGLVGGEALAAGGGLAGGVLGAGELASILGGGSAAGLTGGAVGAGELAAAEAPLTGGALPGATPVQTTGVSNIPLGSPSAGGVPADVLSGQTGPLTALQPQNVPFETLWQETAGLKPSTDISGVLGGGRALSLTETAPVNPLATLPDTGAFGGAPPAVPGQAPTSAIASSLGVEDPLTGGTPFAGTGVPSIDNPTIPFTATPATNLATAPIASDVAASQAVGSTAAPGSLTSAGGGVSGGLSGLLSGSNLRTAAMLAPLGALGLTLARGQPSLPPAEQAAVANVGPGSPIANVAQTQLQEGATGQLTPAQATQVQQYVTNATNELYQMIANQGGDPRNSTNFIQGQAQIAANAQVMTQQFVSAAIQNGIQAQGVIDSTLQNAARIQVAQDEAFQQSVVSATQAFGLTAALTAATTRA